MRKLHSLQIVGKLVDNYLLSTITMPMCKFTSPTYMDDDGTVSEQATWYYPYGMPTCDSRNAAVNRYKYTAKELITDHATYLYDYGARMYLGQWLSVDELTHSNAPTSLSLPSMNLKGRSLNFNSSR